MVVFLPICAMVCTAYALVFWMTEGIDEPHSKIVIMLNAGMVALSVFFMAVRTLRLFTTSEYWVRNLLLLFITALLILGIGSSLAMQGYTNSMTPYTIILIGLSASFRLMPRTNIILSVCACIIMLAGLVILQDSPLFVRTLATSVITSSIVAVVIAQLIIKLAYHDFIQRRTIEHQTELIMQQNAQLGQSNAELRETILQRDEKMTALDKTVQELVKQKSIAERYLHQNIEFQEIKERFVKSSIHDLKNPLAGLMLIADTLVAGKRKATLSDTDLGNRINEVSRRILLVVNSLLAELNLFSVTIDSAPSDTEIASSPFLQQIFDEITDTNTTGTAPRNSTSSAPQQYATDHDLFAVVEQVTEDISPLAERKQQKFRSLFSGSGSVYAPYNSLLRIIENILSNAIKYTPAGGEITLSLTEMASTVVLIVQDSGLGFTAEEAASLFTKPGKRSSIPTGGETSHGLGLQSTVILLTEIQGTISVESPGKGLGSTFTITFPKVSHRQQG